MYRNTFIIQESTTWTVFLTVAIIISVSLQVFAAPTSSNLVDYKASKEDGRKSIHHRSNVLRHFHHHRQINVSGGPRKDTYSLLAALRKKQGLDGLSPVCRICRINFVDAKTYDYFCLPDSEGMNGETCDMLTFLGTTTMRHISTSCKLLTSRVKLTCTVK